MMLRYFLLLLLSVNLLSCGGGDGSDQTTPLKFDPFTDQIDPLAHNIGFFPLYSYRRDSALLAIKQINAIGGILQKRLNLLAVNFQTVDASNTVDVVEVTRRMLEEYKIPVVGVGSSSITLKIAPTIISHKAVLIGDSATSQSITTLEDNDFVFRIPPSDKLASQFFAQFALDRQAQLCTTLHIEGDNYGENLTAEFAKVFEQQGGTVIHNVIIPQGQSTGFSQFFPQIFNTNGISPDCVFPVLLQSTTTANFLNEASSVAFSGFYLLSDAAIAQGFAASISDTKKLEGSVALTPGFGPRTAPEYTYFYDNYFQQYQQEPLNYAAHSYDFIMTAALAIEHAGLQNKTAEPTGEMIRNSLRQIANPPGVAVGPSEIGKALALLRAGQAIDYNGASNPNLGWDNQGDVTGRIAYDLFFYDAETKAFQLNDQIVLDVDLPNSG